MQPAAEQLNNYLQEIDMRIPNINVVQNVDVKAYTDVVDIKDALYRQLFNPVRWVESIRHIISSGVSVFIELGPGKVLTGLCKRIDRKVPCHGVYDLKSFGQAVEQMENM